MNPKIPSLDGYKISREDLLSRILIACADIINSDLNHFIILDAFALASSSNANKCSWHIVYPYARFIGYRDLEGFVKKVADRVENHTQFLSILTFINLALAFVFLDQQRKIELKDLRFLLSRKDIAS